MGPDASVLHTRQVRDGWMGWLGRTAVEVTAGLRDTSDSPATIPMHRASRVEVDSRALSSNRLSISHSDFARTMANGSLPDGLQPYYTSLVASGVPADTVNRWLETTTSFAMNLGEPNGEPNWHEHLLRSISREIRLGGPIRTQPGERHIVALVGPTGVGKTTTVAKLAAGFRIEARRRVALLTIDTFRIAAVQQLRAYAEIMDLPMEVVENPQQMRPALDRLGEVDLVLIDTAGRSPRSDARIEQLVELLSEAQPDETHLVISATHSTSSIHSVLQGFAPVQPTAVILTKLDEAPHTAGAVSALAESRLPSVPLSYVTTGQQVPDDIEVASVDRLFSRLLPTDAVNSGVNRAEFNSLEFSSVTFVRRD
jgi:flagellar biosynthesis protein FlhF